METWLEIRVLAILKVACDFNPYNAQDFFRPKHKNAKLFENHLNDVKLVFNENLSLLLSIYVPGFQ